MDLKKQYNNFAAQFADKADAAEENNDLTRDVFFGYVDFITPGIKLIDLACGDGFDLEHYQKLGAEIYGIDTSDELVKLALQRLPDSNIQVGDFEQIPYPDYYFDAVVSKYALMTSLDLAKVFTEINRVLKPGGVMLYLVTHPFRQYFEKKSPRGDYFKQEIVDSHILHDSVTVKEPTHTMGEYLNEFLFKNFDVQMYDERWDGAVEAVDGRKYPGFFILKATKRMT